MLRPDALKHLHPGWFSIVMGLAGLALAWAQASRAMGELAGAAALALAALAALVFVALAALSWWRWLKHPQALAADLAHPVRHTFVAAPSISLFLLSALAVSALGATSAWVAALWWLASLLQWAATVWTLGRWLGPRPPGWTVLTPALYLPAVGNVLAPLAGVALETGPWMLAQFGAGVLLWLLVTALLLARLVAHGMWTQRLLPLTFITITPPSLVGAGVLQLGGPQTLAWMCWGAALLFVMWGLHVMRALLAQPFSLNAWALSFPLAAFAALSMRLGGGPGEPLATLALLSLAFVSLVVAALTLATFKGLRDGSLLAPEQVPLNVSAAPAAGQP